MIKEQRSYVVAYIIYTLLLSFFWNHLESAIFETLPKQHQIVQVIHTNSSILLGLLIIIPFIIGGCIVSRCLIKEEKSILISKMKYETAVRQSLEGLFAYHLSKEKFVEANDHFCKLLEYSEEELKEMSLTDIISADAKSIESNIDHVKNQEKPYYIGERQYIKKNGDLIDVEMRATVMDVDHEKHLLVTVNDISDRKTAERKLKNSVEEYRELSMKYSYVIDNIEDIIYKLDNNGEIVYLNSAWHKMLGYRLEESIGVKYNDFLYPEDVEKAQILKVQQQKGIPEFQKVKLRFITLNGEVRFCEVNSKLFFDENGEVNGIIGTIRDITQQRLIKNKSKEIQERLSLIYHSVADAIFLIEVLGNEYYFRSINKAYLDNLEIEEKEVIDFNLKDVLPDEVKPEIMKRYDHAISTMEMQSYEETLTLRSGKKSMYRTRVYPVHHKSTDNLYLLGISTNITEQKKVEMELEESQQKYKSLFEYNQNTTFILNEQGRFMEVNGVSEKLTGYKAEELIGTHFRFLLTNKDAETIIPKLHFVLHGRSENFEASIIHKNGQIIYLNVNVMPLVVKGNIIGIIGVAANVTRQKEAERNLRESEERYRSLIQLSPEAIFVANKEEIIFVNDKAKQFLGAKRKKDIIGKPLFQFIYEDDRTIVIDKTMMKFERNDIVPTYSELRFNTLDGRILTCEIGVTIINYNGEKALLGVIHDITERIRSAEQLKEANRLLKDLSQSDGLTEIANRRYFDYEFARVWEEAKEKGKPLSLIMLDIDHFKLFNDTYGHLQGDQCLKEVAKALKSSLKRTIDFVARYGGEEFSIILPEMGVKEAMKVANSVITNVENLQIPHKSSPVKPYVTISAGFSTIIPNDEIDKDILIQSADKALYQSKRAGRNRSTEYRE